MFQFLERTSTKDRFGPARIHYLHIGKTAGNQIKYVLKAIQQENPGTRFQLHPHSTRLERLHPDARYFFSIRHPVTRFKAAFYERKRQDHGRNLWSSHEEESFASFDHAVELAEALFDDSERGRAARDSIWSIEHMRKPQSQWFVPLGHFLKKRPPVWIVRQERLDDDLDELFSRLNLLAVPTARAGKSEAKITSYTDIPELSAHAIENLSRWYTTDIQFYRDCCDWLESQAPAQ